ncbi:type VI secretion system contractile sheath domain-containing protein [uncultured Paludibaculum sp.]|uniref:type VI secretion system contractile sheath domain-containing protein n=1 Tax=uncultured Paludibaculum sp. TaxID=1765020 RepID=UPI002AABB7AF|nr:type VI secretion system contractile sheath large subunit [uncultured Paludibaculum sp.]
MDKTYSLGGINLDVTAGREKSASREQADAKPDPGTPFRVLVLGDFSGRANRSVMETGRKLAARKPILVDRDNFDDVLKRLNPHIDLPAAGTLRFMDLDDFHPDRIYESTEFFRALREARKNPEKMATETRVAAAPPPPPPVPSGPAPKFDFDSLLERAVEATEGRKEGRGSKADDAFSRWLKAQVAPHLVAPEAASVTERRALIDQASSVQMRALLHSTALQSLEAAWRSLFFLVRRVETGADLSIHILDISKEELAADLIGTESLGDSGTFRLLAESSTGVAGGDPWAVLVGNYTFGPGTDDLRLLVQLGTIAGALNVPWISAAAPAFLGCDSLASVPDYSDWKPLRDENWEALRRSEIASSLGLILPRFLLRMPYGKKSDECELFPFEEIGADLDHEEYLWGNAAFVCAVLMAEAFTEDGWSMRPGRFANVGGLPVDVRDRDGERVAQPCAEVLMAERGAAVMVDLGLMPLASLKNSDEVRLVRFQSIAYPAAALSGRWS